MIKENVIEFLFNNKKYKVEKLVLQIFFGFIVLYISIIFQVSLVVVSLFVLSIVLVTSIIKILWYNKKKDIKTHVTEKIGVIICLVATTWVLFLNFNENKLENAVNEVVEEQVGREAFSIEFIDKMEYKENYIAVGYTIDNDTTKYIGWYYWRDGELVHDITRKIGDENE
ncbi:hypothetical protein ACTWP4_13835 [Gracilibacillus sp. D59]|uniref:hypothetical protein n=1 Tax=Gracilibacillus sp. D59 TaxID=3457434 RepID=UPI003FCD6127